MEAPSLLDVYAIIILIIPGFFSSIIVDRFIPSKRRKLSDFEITIYSLTFSLPILIFYSLITGVRGIDAIRDSIFQPLNLAILFCLSLVFGLIPGAIVWLFTRGKYVVSECWDEFRKGLGKGAYVIVYTDSEREYRGWIHFFDLSEGRRGLILGDPKLILRDKDWKILDEIEIGREMLFTKKDIRRIASLTPFE